MAGFVCLQEAPPVGLGYRVSHFRVDDPPKRLEHVVFAAFTKLTREPFILPESFMGGETKLHRIGNIDLAVVYSKLSLYPDPKPSRSAASGALYCGHFLPEDGNSVVEAPGSNLDQEGFGMLLQYLPPGATTTAHIHSDPEGYYRLSGEATVYSLKGDAAPGEEAGRVQLSHHNTSAFIAKGNEWHPLKGVRDSLVIIVAHKSIVSDQVYGTRNNHHRSMPFAEFATLHVSSNQAHKC